jgi:hypothetical protein
MEPSIISVPLVAGIAAIPKPNVLSIPLAHKQLLLKQPLPTPAEHSSQPVKPKWSRLLVTHLPARAHLLMGAVVTIEVVEDVEVLDVEIPDVDVAVAANAKPVVDNNARQTLILQLDCASLGSIDVSDQCSCFF